MRTFATNKLLEKRENIVRIIETGTHIGDHVCTQRHVFENDHRGTSPHLTPTFPTSDPHRVTSDLVTLSSNQEPQQIQYFLNFLCLHISYLHHCIYTHGIQHEQLQIRNPTRSRPRLQVLLPRLLRHIRHARCARTLREVLHRGCDANNGVEEGGGFRWYFPLSFSVSHLFCHSESWRIPPRACHLLSATPNMQKQKY